MRESVISVRDHGLETLRKSAHQVKSGDKSEYYHLVDKIGETDGSFNSVEVQKTTVTTSKTRITTIDGSADFSIINKGTYTIYVGESTVTALTGFPLEANDCLDLVGFNKSDGNEIYAITSSGSSSVYCIGSIKE